MIKKLIFLTVLVACWLSVFAGNLEDEIQNYTESDYVYIGKARQMMADQISFDLPKVLELTWHLNEKYQNSYFIPINFWEQITIGLAAQNVELVQNAIISFKDYQSFDNKQFYEKDALYVALDDFLANNYAIFVSRVEAMQFIPEDRDFAQIFLAAISNQLIDEIDQDNVNKLCDEFLINYPDSEFSGVVKGQFRWVYKPSNWGFGMDFGGGYNLYSEDFGKYFNNGGALSMSFSTSYNKFNFRAEIIASMMKSKIDFNEGGDWKDGEDFSMGFYGLNVGYSAWENKRWKLEPHLKFGGSQLDYDPDDDDEDVESVLFPSVTPAVGLGIYLKLTNSVKDSYYTFGAGYYYLLLNCDYYYPMFEQRYDDYSGGSISFTLSLGFYLRNMERDY